MLVICRQMYCTVFKVPVLWTTKALPNPLKYPHSTGEIYGQGEGDSGNRSVWLGKGNVQVINWLYMEKKYLTVHKTLRNWCSIAQSVDISMQMKCKLQKICILNLQ